MNGGSCRALRDGRSVNENFEDFGLSEFSCSEEMTLLKLMLAKDPESRPTAKEIGRMRKVALFDTLGVLDALVL